MENTKHPAQLITANSGQGLSLANNSYRIVISGRDTGGAYAVIEMLVPPGGGPGPHAHADFQESFHVLDGEIELQTEDGKVVAHKGDFVNIPLGGIIHCFKNKTDQMARLWCTVVPAGLDAFFEEIGQPSAFGTYAPAQPPTPEMMQRLQGIAEKYGQKLYPPDYFDQK